MKYIISLLFFSISVFGFDYHLKPYTMAKDVECFFGLSSIANKINGGNIINSCYVKTKNGYVVIDSGPTYSYAQQANQSINTQEKLPVKYVINTTAEETHILGSSFYQEQGAILIGPKKHKDFEKRREFKLEKSIGKDTFQNTRIVKLDQYIDSNKTIYIDDLDIHIIKIIDSNDNYLIVHIPKRGIIFVGDMVFNNRLPSLKSGRSIVRWLKALKIIENTSWQHLISAHGIHTKYTAIKNTKSYLSILKNTINQKIENGESKQSIIQSTKMFSFMEDVLYDKCHKDNISFAYDELVKKAITIPETIKKYSEPSIRYYGFNQAIKKATAKQKIVLLKIRSDNCPFCNELDNLLRENDKVKRLINQNFVMVTMNNSKDEIPLNIKVSITPSLVFIRADTKEVKMIIPGVESIEELVNTLKEGIADGHKDGYLKK